MPEPFSVRKINIDGSRNIFCNRCKEFICTMATMDNFFTALCVVCQASDRGEVLPKELLDQLRSRKIGHEYVPVFIAEPALPVDPMGDDLSIKTGRLEYFVKVISRKAKRAIDIVQERSEKSIALAKEKRKSRIFDKPID